MARRILPTLVVGIGEFGRLTIEHLRRRLAWADDPDPIRLLFGYVQVEDPEPAPPSPPPQASQVPQPSDDAEDSVVVFPYRPRAEQPVGPDGPPDIEGHIRAPIGPTGLDTLRVNLRPILRDIDRSPTDYTTEARRRQAEAAAGTAWQRSDTVGNAVRAIVLAELQDPDAAALAHLTADALRGAMPHNATLHTVGVFSLCAEREGLPGVFAAVRDLGLVSDAPRDGDPDATRLFGKAYAFFARNREEALSELGDRAELAGEWCLAALHMDAIALRDRHCLDGPVGAIGARCLVSSAVPVAERAARDLGGEVLDAMQPDLILHQADRYSPKDEQPDDDEFGIELGRLVTEFDAKLADVRERTRERVSSMVHDVTVERLLTYDHFVRSMRDREIWADQVLSVHGLIQHGLLARCREQATNILEEETAQLKQWMQGRVRHVLYGWLRPAQEGGDGAGTGGFVLNGLSYAYHWVQSIVYRRREQEVGESVGYTDVSATRDELAELVGDLRAAVRQRPYPTGFWARLILFVLLLYYLALPLTLRLLHSPTSRWGWALVAGMALATAFLVLWYHVLPDLRARACLRHCLAHLREQFKAAQEQLIEEIARDAEHVTVEWVKADLIDSPTAPMRVYAARLRDAQAELANHRVFEPRPIKIIDYMPQPHDILARKLLDRARQAVREWYCEAVAPAYRDRRLAELDSSWLAETLYAQARERCLTLARQTPGLTSLDDWFRGLSDVDRERVVLWLRNGSEPYVQTTHDDRGVLSRYLACPDTRDVFATTASLARNLAATIPVRGCNSVAVFQVREGFDLRHTQDYEEMPSEPPAGSEQEP